ncbi:YafY family protein [Nesterenkonia halobia]
MADTTARALQMLELLQSAQLRTVAELAERLGVDERTVRRDVERLSELGLPVETVRGRYGGYRLASGRRVLPLMFSKEEVIAVFLGLTRSQAASQARDSAARTALGKIRRAMSTADVKRMEALLGTMTSTSHDGDAAPESSVMLTLAEAVDRRQVVDLRYLSGRGSASRRTIHPYALVTHAERWYLLAFDVDKQDERTFRADRIRTARLVPGTFSPPLQSEVEDRLLERFATADYRWQVVLRIRQTQEHIRSHLPRSVARLEMAECAASPTRDETLPWHRAEIHAESLDWLPSVIAALDCDVIIERPDALRDRVRAAATLMLDAAADHRGRVGP